MDADHQHFPSNYHWGRGQNLFAIRETVTSVPMTFPFRGSKAALEKALSIMGLTLAGASGRHFAEINLELLQGLRHRSRQKNDWLDQCSSMAEMGDVLLSG